MAASTACAPAQIPDQYPKPLIHTPTNHPADRVMIVSIEGFHALDLALWVKSHPQSTLAELSRRGVTYTDARVPWPDTAAGMLAFASGGSPISTGIFSGTGMDRTRKDTACSSLNLDDPDPPHPVIAPCGASEPAVVRVNTIFDQVKQAGGRTAWADASEAYAQLFNGRSGSTLDQIFVPAHDGRLFADSQADDQARVGAVLGWIAPGEGGVVPRIFGLTLTGVDRAERTASPVYADGIGTPGPALAAAMDHADKSLGQIVAGLKASLLFDSTWIVVTATHGYAPLDDRRLRVLDRHEIEGFAKSSAGKDLVKVTADTVGLIWLKTPAKTSAVVDAYRSHMKELGIAAIHSGERLRLLMNTSAEDPRMPDIVLESEEGVLWAPPGLAERPRGHGGFSDDQTHVALLVSGRQLTGRIDKTPVPTTQIAPLILRILGMEKLDLQALRSEHTPALPGIF